MLNFYKEFVQDLEYGNKIRGNIILKDNISQERITRMLVRFLEYSVKALSITILRESS